METPPRKPYLSDDEWDFVALYLTLMDETAPQRRHDLHEIFNGLRPRRPAMVPDAQRPAALGGGLPADATLAGGRRLRGDRARLAGGAAAGAGAGRRADGAWRPAGGRQ